MLATSPLFPFPDLGTARVSPQHRARTVSTRLKDSQSAWQPSAPMALERSRSDVSAEASAVQCSGRVLLLAGGVASLVASGQVNEPVTK